MPRTCLAVVLAAGEGTRMRSSLPKVMHRVAGVPMLHHVLSVAQSAGCNRTAVVAGKGFETVKASLEGAFNGVEVFEQKERLGTGHAVLAARNALEGGEDDVLVLFGDTPLLKPETLATLRGSLADGAAVVVLGFRTADPSGYGRLIEDDGKLVAIREEKDASHEEREIDLCNGGIMGFSGKHVIELLEAISNENAKNEYYLTDAVEIAVKTDLRVDVVEAPESELVGVNTRGGLAEVEALWQEARRKELMASGVTMRAPETVYLSVDTSIAEDVEIEPHVVFGPGVTIRKGARIRAFSHIEGAEVGERAEIGPFARLRPGTKLSENTKVGNFVEVKNAAIETGAKINHLSYVGDAQVGPGANLGAGTITCNYDGVNKHLTKIGEGAFVGSNSALVAPVTIGNGAYVASGSVITEDVPDNALGVARGRQTNKEGYASDIRSRHEAQKKSRNDKP